MATKRRRVGPAKPLSLLQSMAKDMWSIIAQYLCCHDMANVRIAIQFDPRPPFTGECRLENILISSTHYYRPERERGLTTHLKFTRPWFMFISSIRSNNMWDGIRVLSIDLHYSAENIDFTNTPHLRELTVRRLVPIRGSYAYLRVAVGESVQRLTVTTATQFVKLSLEVTSGLQYLFVRTEIVNEISGSLDGLTHVDFGRSTFRNAYVFPNVRTAVTYGDHVFPMVRDLTCTNEYDLLLRSISELEYLEHLSIWSTRAVLNNLLPYLTSHSHGNIIPSSVKTITFYIRGGAFPGFRIAGCDVVPEIRDKSEVEWQDV